jgi:putative ABC transport system permease protein
VLVTCGVALSFVLLVGAGLLIRSFNELMIANRGFQTENRLLFTLSMPGSYWQQGVGKRFLDEFFVRVKGLPGVISAGAVSHRPMGGGDPGMSIDSASGPQVPGQPAPPWAGWRIVSPDYFRAIGLPLLRGRIFDENDKPIWADRGQPIPVRRVVISDRLAKRILPDVDPIGRHVTLWKGQSNLDAEVIGVVADSRERGLSSDPTMTVYIPYGANALTGEIVVHTRMQPLALMPSIRSIVADLDPNLPVADVRSFEDVVSRSVAPQRFNTILLAVFSGLALLLAMIGIYGVLSYTVGRRTSEIGLRVALGASGSQILRMTVSQGLRPALAGILAGAIGSWWLSRYLSTLLYGVQALDPATYFAVAALLLLTAVLACYLPGRRAMRIHPAIALRIE